MSSSSIYTKDFTLPENSLHWSFSMLDSKRAYTKPQREQPDSEMKNVPVQNPCCIKGGIRHLDYFGQQ